MRKSFLILSSLIVVFIFSSCGINKEVHQKALSDLSTAQKNYESQEKSNKKLGKSNAELRERAAKLKKGLLEVLNEKMAINNKLSDIQQRNIDAGVMIENLVGQLKEKGASLEEVEAKQSEMKTQREKMLTERDKLLKDQNDLRAELEEVRKLKEAAEKRSAEFKKIMEKLKSMIDSGKLSVNIRKGRMIVSLSSDILFPSGRTNFTNEGKDAIAELCETLKTLEGRSFLIVGHSDSTPIKTKRFSSNWELSSQRAIEVTRLMIENGVKPEMLSAAGQAEFDPISENDTAENKAKNRRVEIVFMPKIEELPGFNKFMEN